MSSRIHPDDRSGGFSWHPPPRPFVASVDLRIQPADTSTSAGAVDWNRQLAHWPGVEVRTSCPKPNRPRAISVPIGRPGVSVRSFVFAQPADTERAEAAENLPHLANQGAVGGKPVAAQLSGSTRIKPPGDVIKLEDRLHYILQPSLESLLAEGSLSFPFHPFPFQFEGVAFLYPRHAAVLADEMGLGKTMQAVTTIRLLLRRGELRSALLVCPKPLVTNWQREFGLWAPEVPVMVIEGDQSRRCWQWQLPEVAVRIANYELLCRDRQLLESFDTSGRPLVQFDLVALDESQRIKNRSSTTSQVVRSISRRRSWALTGTPVENSVEDLVGIFEFLAPGFLSPEMKPRRMGRTISDYVLRRTKDQVLRELPPKLFRDAEMDLSPEQRESYRLAEGEGVLRLTEMGASATIQHVFELVLRLKQICNFDPATGESAKLERLRADLEEIARSGRKAIVFSQWVCTLKRLAGALRSFGTLEYHGKVPSGRRDAVVRRFREDDGKHVMLMSYGAGGVGLNLQFANYVFLFDRWWNPAVEDQAINRAHRIGVDGPVTVTRFLMLDTIEERIDRILQEKRELFDTIFSGAESHRKLGLTQQELFGLFKLECPGGPIDLAA
ncbi:MAG: DEAD/DEAH box helicase [Pirellulales bacterium]|nr:DEAD/DEAH box helicase [Pirellulales bacterium]